MDLHLFVVYFSNRAPNQVFNQIAKRKVEFRPVKALAFSGEIENYQQNMHKKMIIIYLHILIIKIFTGTSDKKQIP
jgi:hypothetical protein